MLIGDAERVAPSFYYYYAPFQYTPPNNRWVPTDFFYNTQSGYPFGTGVSTPGADASGTLSYHPSYQVSRIPVRAAPLITVDQLANTFPPTPIPSPFGPPFYDPLPFLSKMRDYCDLLNSAPTDVAKETAFATWFSQVVMINGATEYYRWWQFFPGLAQYILSLRVTDITTGTVRDAFSGLLVRKYDLNGPTPTTARRTPTASR